jgi:hypothetical protein
MFVAGKQSDNEKVLRAMVKPWPRNLLWWSDDGLRADLLALSDRLHLSLFINKILRKHFTTLGIFFRYKATQYL